MIKWATILVSIAGLALAVYAVSTHGKDLPPEPPPAAPPSVNPFTRGIAATGQIEAASRNISIAAPEPGLVTEVLVSVGSMVTAGQPLMKLDSRLLAAELPRITARGAVAKATIARMRAMPRAEEMPNWEANADRARVKYLDTKGYYEDLSRAGAKEAASRLEIDRRNFAMQAAEAELRQAEAQLDLMKAGAWDKEIAVAEAELATIVAEERSLETRIDRLTVRSPIAGTVLKRNAEVGQYTSAGAGSGGSSSSAMVIGDISKLHVRARVDEEDAPLLRENAAASLRVRGIAGETVGLKMLRIEPLAVPKSELVNSPTERVDTRVVEVIFEMNGETKLRLFPGQVVDVFIDASDVKLPGPAPQTGAAPGRPVGVDNSAGRGGKP